MIGLGSDKKREKSILIGFAKNSKSESQFKFWFHRAEDLK